MLSWKWCWRWVELKNNQTPKMVYAVMSECCCVKFCTFVKHTFIHRYICFFPKLLMHMKLVQQFQLCNSSWLMCYVVIKINEPQFTQWWMPQEFLVCDVMQSTVIPQYAVRLPVCLSVMFWYCDDIGWNTSKIISQPNRLSFMLGLTPTLAVWSNGKTPIIRMG